MKNNIYLFQTHNLGGHQGKFLAWLPYSIGCIWAYVSQFTNITDNFELKEFICFKEPVAKLVDRLDNPKICGFSTYVWNYNYNLTAAKLIKERYPNCLIVFGGPQINKELLKDVDYIDVMMFAEAELTFKDLLEDYLNNDVKKLYEASRIRDLTILPSPYALGLFNTLLDNHPDLNWAAVIETNRGCPYQCTYCDWGSLTNSKVFNMSLTRLKSDVEWIVSKSNLVQLNIADANFGIFKARDLEVAKILRKTLDEGYIKEIQLSYTKTFNEYLYDIILLLNQPTGFNISLQSDNTDTLKAIKRKNLSKKDVDKLLAWAEANKITHEQEYILGLPLETKQSWYESMTNLLNVGSHKVFDIFICSVLPNTEMASIEYRTKYGIKTVKTPSLNAVAPIIEVDQEIVEYSEIIKETNTLPELELIDCFLFSHIIQHAHATGYTYIISKIAQKHFNISMFDFYTKLEQYMYADDIIGKQLNYVRSLLSEMFQFGQVMNPAFNDEGRFDLLSYHPFFKNKNRLMKLAIDVLKELSNCDSSFADRVYNLQHNYIFDIASSNEITFISPINIETFNLVETTYKINKHISQQEFINLWKGSGTFHLLHQSKQLVNNFTQLQKFKIIPIKNIIK